MNLRSLPYIVLTAFCFGSSLISSRFGIGQFTPVEFVTLRISLAAFAFALILLVNRKERWRPNRRIIQHGLVLGLLATALPMFCFVGALVYLSSGVTSIVNATGPAFTVTMAHFLLPAESLTVRKGLGVLLSLSGAILLASQGESGIVDVSQANPIGYLLVFTGVLSVSASTIYARRYATATAPVAVTSVQMFAAALITLPAVTLIFGFELADVNAQGWLALIYGSVVGTVFAFLLFFYTVRRFSATEASLTTYIVPVVATIGGVLVLDETVTPLMIGGMAIILAGIAVINAKTKGRNIPVR